MLHPLISVIVPIYNIERYISRCVDSLFLQTYQNVELIFIDDCSTDNSSSIVKEKIDKYRGSSSITFVRLHKNMGLSAARNRGIRLAKGEYILHVDGDDFIDKNALQFLFDAIEKTNAEIAVSDFNLVFLDRISSYSHPEVSKREYLQRILSGKCPCCIWGKLISRRLIEEKGIWSINDVNYAEDYAVVPRLIDVANSVCFVHKKLYNYNRTNLSSLTHKLDTKVVSDARSVSSVLLEHFSAKPILINQVKIYIKLLLLKKVNSFDSLNKVFPLYPDIRINSDVSIKDRILLGLASLRSARLILFYQNVRNFCKSVLGYLHFY